jgi:hypothetical protein
LQFLVVRNLVQIPFKVAYVPGELGPDARVESRAVFLHAAAQMIPEMVVIPVTTGETHNAQARRKAFLSEVVLQCRYQLAFGQVAGRTEDHNREGFRIIHRQFLKPSC